MNKILLQTRGLVALLLLVAGLNLSAQTAPKITKIEIKHVGPAATSDALILANIRLKEGDAYEPSRVNDDVKNLYATGFFYNIRVVDNVTSDGAQLTYVVQGNPQLTDVKFTGNKKYSNSKLQKKVTSKAGQPLDEKKVFNDAKEIEKMYEKAGYQKTTVKPAVNIDENTGKGTVTYEVKETGKVKIKEVDFVGATVFEQKTLRKTIKTKRRWWMSWITGTGILKEEQFEDDKDRLMEFYQNEGYIDAEIKEVKFDYVEPTWMIIRFYLAEGKQYKVGTVSFSGNKLYTAQDLDKGFLLEGRLVRSSMTAGKTFTPKGLNKDVDALQDFYGSKGYVDAHVNAVKVPNTAAGTMDVTYEFTEGEKAYIERIDIKGNDKTKDKVIRRELAVYPGEVFDTTRVKLSKNRLLGLNFFEKVDTRPEDTDVPNRKNLIVGVEEKNTGSFTVGAGLSSVDAVVGFVEVSQANFDLFKPPTFSGGGQKFRMKVQLGTERRDYQISFVEPWFLQRKLALGVDLYHRDLNYVSRQDLYDETRTGGSLSLTRALWTEFLIGKVSYTLEHVGLDMNSPASATNPTSLPGWLLNADGSLARDIMGNPIPKTYIAPSTISKDVYDQSGDRLISKIGTSLAFDTRNNATLPTRGQRSEFITELAGVGGDVNYYKLEGRTAWYFPGFFDGHVLEVVGRMGVINDFGDGDRGASSVPLFDRYFLGGLYSLRGYRYREVGPRDGLGEPLGGETFLFGSVEYSLPIIERLRFAMFYDVGNVYSDAFSFDTQDTVTDAFGAKQSVDRRFISDNVGIGLRINLPIGPLRLDYGYPLQHDKDVGGSGRFQFGVGYTREF